MAGQKSLDHRLDELATALRAIMYANNGFSENLDKAHLLTIAGQLRALVCTGGTDMTPLLLGLSDELDVPLTFYSIPVPDAPATDLAMDMIVSKSWSVRSKPGLKLYNLREWLDSPAYFIDSTRDYRTRNQVLKHISNKEGGAHYDKNIVPVIDSMRRRQIGPAGRMYDGVALFLLDMASLVYWQGERLRRTWGCTQSGLDPGLDVQLKRMDDYFDKLQYGIPGVNVIQMFGTKASAAGDSGKGDSQSRRTQKARRRADIARQSRKRNR